MSILYLKITYIFISDPRVWRPTRHRAAISLTAVHVRSGKSSQPEVVWGYRVLKLMRGSAQLER